MFHFALLAPIVTFMGRWGSSIIGRRLIVRYLNYIRVRVLITPARMLAGVKFRTRYYIRGTQNILTRLENRLGRVFKRESYRDKPLKDNPKFMLEKDKLGKSFMIYYGMVGVASEVNWLSDYLVLNLLDEDDEFFIKDVAYQLGLVSKEERHSTLLCFVALMGLTYDEWLVKKADVDRHRKSFDGFRSANTAFMSKYSNLSSSKIVPDSARFKSLASYPFVSFSDIKDRFLGALGTARGFGTNAIDQVAPSSKRPIQELKKMKDELFNSGDGRSWIKRKGLLGGPVPPSIGNRFTNMVISGSPVGRLVSLLSLLSTVQFLIQTDDEETVDELTSYNKFSKIPFTDVPNGRSTIYIDQDGESLERSMRDYLRTVERAHQTLDPNFRVNLDDVHASLDQFRPGGDFPVSEPDVEDDEFSHISYELAIDMIYGGQSVSGQGDEVKSSEEVIDARVKELSADDNNEEVIDYVSDLASVASYLSSWHLSSPTTDQRRSWVEAMGTSAVTGYPGLKTSEGKTYDPRFALSDRSGITDVLTGSFRGSSVFCWSVLNLVACEGFVTKPYSDGKGRQSSGIGFKYQEDITPFAVVSSIPELFDIEKGFGCETLNVSATGTSTSGIQTQFEAGKTAIINVFGATTSTGVILKQLPATTVVSAFGSVIDHVLPTYQAQLAALYLRYIPAISLNIASLYGTVSKTTNWFLGEGYELSVSSPLHHSLLSESGSRALAEAVSTVSMIHWRGESPRGADNIRRSLSEGTHSPELFNVSGVTQEIMSKFFNFTSSLSQDVLEGLNKRAERIVTLSELPYTEAQFSKGISKSWYEEDFTSDNVLSADDLLSGGVLEPFSNHTGYGLMCMALRNLDLLSFMFDISERALREYTSKTGNLPTYQELLRLSSSQMGLALIDAWSDPKTNPIESVRDSNEEALERKAMERHLIERGSNYGQS